jgi:hypothetical protein
MAVIPQIRAGVRKRETKGEVGSTRTQPLGAGETCGGDGRERNMPV